GLAEVVRLGGLDRNAFVDAPALLVRSLQVIGRKRLVLAGQLVGVEGYVESAATGLLAGLNAGRLLVGQAPLAPPRATALGSLLAYVTQRGKKGFQPMNANYGLFPPLARALRGRDKKLAMAERALAELMRWRGCGTPRRSPRRRARSRAGSPARPRTRWRRVSPPPRSPRRRSISWRGCCRRRRRRRRPGALLRCSGCSAAARRSPAPWSPRAPRGRRSSPPCSRCPRAGRTCSARRWPRPAGRGCSRAPSCRRRSAATGGGR